ncbi:unknown [Brachyspira sp. CAG:484]|nr:unknown [Brachyspira sp. CAG:484]
MVKGIEKIDLLTQGYSAPQFSEAKPQKLNSIFASNPIAAGKRTEKAEEKKAEALENALDGVSDSETRAAIKEAYQNGNPSRAFVDYLIKRHEKQQEKFEAAWAEYQASKNNLQFYKKVCETVTKKYENSDSNYEQGLITKADKNFTNAEMTTDLLLDKASMIAHTFIA